MTAVFKIVEDDDEDLTKIVGGGYPNFTVKFFGSSRGNRIFIVEAGDEFIGTLVEKNTHPMEEWYIAFVAGRKMRTHVRVSSMIEGARKLWEDSQGLLQLPEIAAPYEPLLPPTGEPDHYESIKKTANNLVRFLSETEDGMEDADFKDVDHDQLSLIVRTLDQAGFKILRSDKVDDTMYIEFTWPVVNFTEYHSGWKKAREILAPYVSLRQGNFVVSKSGPRGNEIAKASIIKKTEADPTAWKVTPMVHEPGNHGAFWFEIYYQGILRGEIYLPTFNMSSDTAERLREELTHLNEIKPFSPLEWYPAVGNGFGNGTAFDWWRKNRQLLGDEAAKNRPFFDPNTLHPK